MRSSVASRQLSRTPIPAASLQYIIEQSPQSVRIISAESIAPNVMVTMYCR